MKVLPTLLMTVFLALPLTASGQSDAASLEENMTKAGDAFGAMSDFVGDVHFDEKDVKSMLELWPEFQDLSDEVSSRVDSDLDSAADMEAVLKEPTYLAWVEKHGLDRENWLRRVMRIQLLLAKDEYDARGGEGQAEMQKQLKEMEKMRAKVGEQAYQQMMKTMKAGMSMMDSMSETMANLPPATDEERALLDKYQKQLRQVQ